MVTVLISAMISCSAVDPKAFPTTTASPTDQSAVGAQAGLIAAIVSPVTVIVIGLIVILLLVSALVYKRRRKSLQGMYTHTLDYIQHIW